jgi:hypothetical protein
MNAMKPLQRIAFSLVSVHDTHESDARPSESVFLGVAAALPVGCVAMPEVS